MAVSSSVSSATETRWGSNCGRPSMATLRTVFARTAEGRAMLLEGLPPDDARAAARALGEAMSAMS